jgi:hypothetical protein
MTARDVAVAAEITGVALPVGVALELVIDRSYRQGRIGNRRVLLAHRNACNQKNEHDS